MGKITLRFTKWMLWLFIICFISLSVTADYRVNSPNFCGIGEQCYIWADVYPLQEGINYSDYNLTFIACDNTTAEMVWDIPHQYWDIVVVENTTEQDCNFQIYFNNSVNDSYDYSSINTLKFRFPFWVTFSFYKTNQTTATQWKTEFSYVYLLSKENTKTLPPSSSFSTSYLDDWFGWLPFYGEVGNYQGQPRRIDTTESFWAKYDDGEAVVKLYEQNNYTVGIIGVGSEGDFGWGYEFIRPQFADTTYNSLVVNRMDAIFLNETNQSYKIVMTEWEINKMNVLTNLFKYVLFGVLWAVGTYFIFRIDPKVALAFTIFYWGLIKVIGFI